MPRAFRARLPLLMRCRAVTPPQATNKRRMSRAQTMTKSDVVLMIDDVNQYSRVA